MNEKRGKYLPIGSVVMLKGGSKRVMITGFYTIAGNDTSKVYDYNGCLYPEGVISSNQTCLFNHEQIEKIYFIGYEDEEETTFKENLKDVVQKANQLADMLPRQEKEEEIEQLD